MAESFQTVLIGSTGVVYDGLAESVTAPGVRGNFGVLANHAPLISALATGLLKVRIGEREQLYLVGKGFIEVCDNRVVVLVSDIRELDSPELGRRLMQSPDPWKALDLIDQEVVTD